VPLFKPTGNPPPRRNEENADAIKSLDDIEDAFDDAIRWINDRTGRLSEGGLTSASGRRSVAMRDEEHSFEAAAGCRMRLERAVASSSIATCRAGGSTWASVRRGPERIPASAATDEEAGDVVVVRLWAAVAKPDTNAAGGRALPERQNDSAREKRSDVLPNLLDERRRILVEHVHDRRRSVPGAVGNRLTSASF
jgi:hypothetical protein